MTHMSQDLDRICKNWCPIVETCPQEHECGARVRLRSIIWEIAGERDEE